MLDTASEASIYVMPDDSNMRQAPLAELEAGAAVEREYELGDLDDPTRLP
jgi:hypothetical protein